MAGLSSPGLGSGLDINGLVDKLMSVEKAPLAVFDKQEASYQSKLSAYGTLKGVLSSFQTAAKGLTSLSKFNVQTASVSDSTVMTPSATSAAASGSYSVEVTDLAQTHKLRTSSTWSTTTTTLGAAGDTLTLDFGTYSGGAFTLNPSKGTKTVTLASGQNTLSGVRDAINAASVGVTATLVNDGSGYRLLLSGADSGEANALRIVASSGLSALAYDASTGGTSNMVQLQAAQNAAFTLDGISMSQSSNTVTNAIDGVSFTLLKETTAAVTLSISRDTSGVKTAIESFVKTYNDAATSLKTLTAYDASTKKGAVLLGDATAMSLQSKLRNVINQSLTYAGGGLTTLSDIGISFRKDGSLSLDYTKMNAVLANTSKDVSTLFTAVGKPTDSLTTFTSSTSDTQPGQYASRVTRVATRGGVTGTAAQGTTTTINSGNNALSLTVNGVAASVTLAAASYSNAGLLSAVQSAVNGNSTLSGAGISVTASMNGTQASVAGASTAGLTINAANKTFDVTVDSTAVSITLDEATYTAATLSAHVQSKINANATLSAAGKSVTVSQANGVLTVKSNRYGTNSGLVLTASAATANLFGGTGAGTSTGTGTSTLTLTSDQYGAVSNVNITGGTGATDLFGAATATGTAGKHVGGNIFSTSGLTQGTATGATALSGTQTVDGTNNALSVTLDGTAASVTLDAGSYSVAQLAAHIQSKINADSTLAAAGKSVTVSADSSGKLVITSNNWGSASTSAVDGGTAATAFFGTVTSVAGTGTVTATAQGKAVGNIALSGSYVVDSSNNALSLAVEGTSASVTLDSGTYTASELAAHIQSKINANSTLAAAGRQVTAALDGSNLLTITSDAYGPASSVTISSSTAATAFIGTATSTAGTGTATGLGTALTAVSGNATGMKLAINGGAVGARGTVAYEQGFAYRLDQAIEGMLSSTGTIASRTDGINRSIRDIGSRRTTLNRRLVAIEARYRRQFNALDSVVASMQQTSAYLQQQLSKISSSNS